MINLTKVDEMKKGMIKVDDEYLFNLTGVLRLCIDLATDKENGITGCVIDNFIRDVYKLEGFEALSIDTMQSILKEKDVPKLITNATAETDINIQLLSIIRLIKLVSDVVKSQNGSEIERLNQINQSKDKKIEELERQAQISIQREIQTNEELNRFKKRHDKEVRKLQHEIDRLKNKLEGGC